MFSLEPNKQDIQKNNFSWKFLFLKKLFHVFSTFWRQIILSKIIDLASIYYNSVKEINVGKIIPCGLVWFRLQHKLKPNWSNLVSENQYQNQTNGMENQIKPYWNFQIYLSIWIFKFLKIACTIYWLLFFLFFKLIFGINLMY